METQHLDLFPNEIKNKNLEIKNALMTLWEKLYSFESTKEYRSMELQDKRAFKTIEDKLFKISKSYYDLNELKK